MSSRGGVAALSPREVDVLSLMADGLTNDAIAARTFLSIKSIEAVVRSIFTKLGLVESRHENRRVLAVRVFLDQAVGDLGTLPTPMSSFVGRDDEIETLTSLLNGHRLITVTGPGGIGKTRLVVELGDRLAGEGCVGRFVDLAATVDDVVGAVATCFGLRAVSEAGGRRQLQRMMEAEPCVVMLDNAEHVISGVTSLLPTLLQPADARVIVTSREPLSVAGELVWRTPPLAPIEATRLLRERMYEATGCMVPVSDDELSQLAEPLAGIPLAIELFARRLAVIPVDEVVSRMNRLPDLLSQPTDGRHRSLRAVLNSSCQMLKVPALDVFRRASLFVGGFTLDAARRLANGSVAATSVADDLETLVRCSLVEFRAGRYRLLEPIRQYAAELLHAANENDEAIRSFVQWGADFSRRAWTGFSSDSAYWHRRLEAEAGNIEAAVIRACDTDDTAAAVRIVRNLFLYWSSERPIAGLHSTRYLLDHLDGSEPPSDRAWALLAAGALDSITGDLESAESMLADAVDVFRSLDDGIGESLALLWLGRQTGDVQHLDRAAELAVATANPIVEAWAHLSRGALISRSWESYAACAARIARADEIAQATQVAGLLAAVENQRACAMLIANWTGESAFPAADIEAAIARGLTHAKRDGGLRTVEGARNLLALARLHLGPTELALQVIDAHLTGVQATEDRQLIAEAILIAAAHLARNGRHDLTSSLVDTAAPVFRSYAHPMWVSFVLHTSPELVPPALACQPTQCATTDELVHTARVAQQLLKELYHRNESTSGSASSSRTRP